MNGITDNLVSASPRRKVHPRRINWLPNRSPEFSATPVGYSTALTSVPEFSKLVTESVTGNLPYSGMAFIDPNRLEKARAQVIADPEILSGTPVIKGTRVPVYDVAASVASAIPMERILACYPSLNREQVELAALYAEAHPPREAPRRRALPPGAKIISSSRRKLRSAQ